MIKAVLPKHEKLMSMCDAQPFTHILQRPNMKLPWYWL